MFFEFFRCFFAFLGVFRAFHEFGVVFAFRGSSRFRCVASF